MNQTARHPDLDPLDALVGKWSTSMTHPASPSLDVSGTSTFEWLEGRHFLIGRSVTDHPDFPDGLTVLGADADTDADTLAMHYYDSRGVQRIYRSSRIEDGVWKMWRDDPDFSQRFTGTFSEDGNTITGMWELSRDGESWDDDLGISYRRIA
jgi:hypothetical protein